MLAIANLIFFVFFLALAALFPAGLFNSPFLTTFYWVFGLVTTLVLSIAFFPTLLLLNLSAASSSRVTESFFKNPYCTSFRIAPTLYLFLCLFLALMQGASNSPIPQQALFIIFLAATFALLTLMGLFMETLYKHLDSKEILKFYEKRGEALLGSDNPTEGLEWVDTLNESGIKKLVMGNVREAEEASAQILELAKGYFANKKRELIQTNAPEPVYEEIQFFNHYFSKQFEALFEKAINLHSQKFAGTLINQLGKLSLAVGDLEPSFVDPITEQIEECARKSLKHNLPKMAIQAHFLLKEVASQWLSKDPGQVASYFEPMETLIGSMEKISEEIFRFDKTIDPALLKTPYLQLLKKVSDLAKSSSLDTKTIEGKLDSVIKNFDALKEVMEHLPREES